MLQGGLRCGEVTELTGVSTSGKTQLCLSAVAACVGRGVGRVVYVDTVSSFSAARVVAMLPRAAALLPQRTLRPQQTTDALQHVRVLRCVGEGQDGTVGGCIVGGG
jgi:RAD51-like protein 3